DLGEITHILLDDKHNFNDIEEIEIVSSDIQDAMSINAMRTYDNVETSYKIAHEAYYVQDSELERIAPASARFESKSVMARFWTLFAGPLMNFVLAFVLFTLLFYINGKPVDEPIVGMVAEDTPAEEAGLVAADSVATVHDTEGDRWDHMSEISQEKGESTLDIEVEHPDSGEVRDLEMTPVINVTELPDGETAERLIIGIGAASEEGTIAPLWWGVQQTYEMGTLIFELVVQLFISIFEGTFSFDM